MIQAERKYEPPYEFQNHATLLFSANRPPKADDDTYAYERRWLYFDFPNTFEGDDAENQDDLLEAFEREHPAILNQAAAAFRNLWERGGFEDTVLMREYEGAHERLTDPVYEFVMDNFERDDGAYVRINEALDAAHQWAAERGHPKPTKGQLKYRVNAEFAPSKGADPDEGRFNVWNGIRLSGAGEYQSGLGV